MTHLAIIGTGAVGLEALSILNEGDIQYDSLRILATKSSAGTKHTIRGEEYVVEEYSGSESLKGVSYAVLATPSAVSQDIVESCHGHEEIDCVFIDNSSHFRMRNNVPLVIPEINFAGCEKSVIIANPNCVTIILLMVIAPLNTVNKVKRIDLVTMQSASGAGIKGMKELESQAINYPAKKYSTDFFGKQYHMNVFSHNSEVDEETGFNDEEEKVMNETKKILNTQDIELNVTCMRVPVLRSHTETVTIEFENPISEQDVRGLLNSAKGVTVIDQRKSNIFPEPYYLSGKDNVYVGRIRKCHDQKNHEKATKYQFHIVGDQLRKGAALNALQIYEKLISI
jgi:aspartate-semialdehyde dehydrogenase